MIAIDTNILVRIFVNDDTQQSFLAKKLVDNCDSVFITTIVQLEFTWVLRHSLKFSREDIVRALTILKEHPLYQLENAQHFANALALYKNNSADFSDYLILSHCQSNHYQLWTFDKKLAKHPDVALLVQH